MKIKDGFKFGLGWAIGYGILEYLEEVLVKKNPKYLRPWRQLAATIKGQRYEEKEYIRDRKTGIYAIKNKIGFRID